MKTQPLPRRGRRGVALLIATLCIPLMTAASAVLLSNMADMRHDTDNAIARAHMRNMLASAEFRHRRRSVWSGPSHTETEAGFPEVRLGKFRGVIRFSREKAADGQQTKLWVKVTGPGGMTLKRQRDLPSGD
ncbi:MAG: hypothetical protein ACLFV7_15010 [Phycisphaerae bacterium]